jgi:hypothetical protein
MTSSNTTLSPVIFSIVPLLSDIESSEFTPNVLFVTADVRVSVLAGSANAMIPFVRSEKEELKSMIVPKLEPNAVACFNCNCGVPVTLIGSL